MLNPLSSTSCLTCHAPLGVVTRSGPTATGVQAPPGMRSCPSCGNEVPAAHRFCGFCGARLEAVEQKPAWTAAATTRARLVLIKSEGQDGIAFPLSEGEHVAGRLEGGILFPEDPLLSPRHATFILKGSKLTVRDDSSQNGVFVRLRAPRIVSSGALILVGEQLLRVVACPPEQVPVPDAEGTYFYGSPHRPSRLALVQVLVGGETGLVYRARNDQISIGREGNDVNFAEDPFISGRHAQILTLDDGRFQISDLGSKNGTYEKAPAMTQLSSGDFVFLGQQLLRVELS